MGKIRGQAAREKDRSVAVLVDSKQAIPFVRALPRLLSLMRGLGRIRTAKIVLLQQQALEYAKEVSSEGFLPVIVHDDPDIHFVLEVMELVYNEKIHVLALVTENEDFLPLFARARELGKEVILVQLSEDVSRGLRKAADFTLSVES